MSMLKGQLENLLDREITVRYKDENGEMKERLDVIKDYSLNEDGTIDLIFKSKLEKR